MDQSCVAVVLRSTGGPVVKAVEAMRTVNKREGLGWRIIQTALTIPTRIPAGAWLVVETRACLRQLSDVSPQTPIIVLSENDQSNQTEPDQAPTVLAARLNQHRFGAMAAEHLIACGYRHFGICGRDIRDMPIRHQQRVHGFKEVLKQNGYTCTIIARPSWPRAMQTLADSQRPMGLYDPVDASAHHLRHAILSAGLRIPEDFGIVGTCNDPDFYAMEEPALTSIEPPWHAIGTATAHLLRSLITQTTEALTTAPPTLDPSHLIPRNSTKVLDGGDDWARQVTDWIAANIACNDILKQLAQEHGCSENTLAKRYRQACGRNIKATHLELRMDRAREHLTSQPQQTIGAIANTIGYATTAAFTGAFRKHFGLTPSEFRKQYGAS